VELEIMQKQIEIYLGPMSKNIVDSVIEFAEKYQTPMGVIASRRQVDRAGGYVNGWTTRDFAHYVKDRNYNVIICRDHGGIGQGRIEDDGIDSLLEDAECMDIIHIDPWKKLGIRDAIEYTADMIRRCSAANGACLYEIGTEESIFPMTAGDLDLILRSLSTQIPKLFSRIQYAVIQSGTSLKNGINTGEYSEERLLGMVHVCRKYGVLAKEHNGDYLSPEQIKRKFRSGLSSINIAPEVAHIETVHVLKNISDERVDRWFDLCIKDGQWHKWFSKDFDPASDKQKVLRLCGHYVFNHDLFRGIFDLNSISLDVFEDVSKFILERLPYGL
jgi:hypothetical protein